MTNPDQEQMRAIGQDLDALQDALEETRMNLASALARAEAAENRAKEAAAGVRVWRDEHDSRARNADRWRARAETAERERDEARAEAASLRERVRALAEEWHVQREEFAEADEDDCCAAVIGTFVGELRALLAPTTTPPAAPEEETETASAEAHDCTCIAPNPACPNCNGTGRYQP